MKKLFLSNILLLCFSYILNAQFLGKEMYCKQITWDSFDIEIDIYQDASINPIEDTTWVYAKVIANYPQWQLKTGKQSQTLLYDSVYHVKYSGRHQILSFTDLFMTPGNFYFANNIEGVNLDNYSDSIAYLNFAGGWGFPPSSNMLPPYDTPVFNHSQFSFYESGGYIKHDASAVSQLGNPLNYKLVIMDTTHTYPSDIFIDSLTGVMSIDTNLRGKYLIYIAVESTEEYLTRTMIIDVEKIKLQLATSTLNVVRKEEDFIVFPNPVTNVLNVRSEAFIQELKIIDMSGQVVWQQSVKGFETKLMVEDLPKGQYIIQVKINGDSYFKIVQKVD